MSKLLLIFAFVFLNLSAALACDEGDRQYTQIDYNTYIVYECQNGKWVYLKEQEINPAPKK